MNNRFKFRVWDKVNEKYADSKNICWGDYYKRTGNAASGESGELLIDTNGDLRIATYPCGNGDNSADSVFVAISNNDDFLIQQYTGLKDCSNIDIYEGDILQDISEAGKAYGILLYQVYWLDTTASFELVAVNEYDTHIEYDEPVFRLRDMSKLKKVCNIFENKELLN